MSQPPTPPIMVPEDAAAESHARATAGASDGPDRNRVTTDAAVLRDPAFVLNLLKHRYPFLLVDRVLEVGYSHIIALKNVSHNEPFFNGHFPGDPIMPGVLIIEGMAQAGCICVGNRHGAARLMYLASIEKARFRKPVRPGDVLRYEVRMLAEKRKIGKVEGRTLVGDDVVAEVELLFSYAD